MNDASNLFIEETLSNGMYQVVWKGTNGYGDIETALDMLMHHLTNNRLELWSKAHATTDKGYAPIAYREKNAPKGKIQISNTLKMLMGV